MAICMLFGADESGDREESVGYPIECNEDAQIGHEYHRIQLPGIERVEHWIPPVMIRSNEGKNGEQKLKEDQGTDEMDQV